MELKEYFDNNTGFGVLSTANGSGNINSAVYARPHVMEDGSLAFIMRERLTHKNIRLNPHATYLFREDGPGYKGKRLYLTKLREEIDSDLIASLARRNHPVGSEKEEPRYLVYFRLEKERPLLGGEY